MLESPFYIQDLRSHAESLEQRLIDKDSKILELEFRIEKTERVCALGGSIMFHEFGCITLKWIVNY